MALGPIDIVEQRRLRDHAPTMPGWLSLITEALRTARGVVGGLLVAFVVLVAALGPAVAADSPTAFSTGPFAPPSGQNLLGGDTLGRYVLSRVLNGGWQLLLMATLATILGVAIGAAIGIAAAFWGGRSDSVLMRAVDVLLAFPQIVIAVAMAHAPQVARVMRSAALDVCERDFVKSAELIALRASRLMVGEILPNLTSPLMVETGLRLTYSIVLISGLSFLGFGLQPPSPNWGSMINENRVGLVGNP